MSDDCPTVRLITVEKASLTIQPFQEITTIKLSTVWSFSQTLLRYTSLNHLTQAARAVLQNQQQITQMLVDLNRVDFPKMKIEKQVLIEMLRKITNQYEEFKKITNEYIEQYS